MKVRVKYYTAALVLRSRTTFLRAGVLGADSNVGVLLSNVGRRQPDL